ncbi:MAG TPA: NAD(P)H-binding protein [Rhizomicrobium sp.]|jgi:hypothetical protein
MKRKRATERVVVGDGQAALDGVRGADAVISAVGGGGETLTTFAETIVAAMRQADVSRNVSLIGASTPVCGDRTALVLTNDLAYRVNALHRTAGNNAVSNSDFVLESKQLACSCTIAPPTAGSAWLVLAGRLTLT